MKKPRILIRLSDVIHRALARGLPTWREKVSLGVIVLATLIAIALLNPIRESDPMEAERKAGWVTNCSGPEFAKFSQTNSAGPGGTSRPVFKISDELVLAVPKINRPYVGDIERFPRKCRTIGDLPKAPYLYFVVQGNWSGNYDPSDIPLQDGRKKFLPDAVTVRVEQDPPTRLSIEDQREVARTVNKTWDEHLDQHDVDGLICGRDPFMRPHPRDQGGLWCQGHRTPSDPDIIRLSTKSFGWPFVLLDADYESSHYGKIHVYWWGWTSDLAHAREIDLAIWNLLAEWNLASEPATRPGSE